MANTAPIVTLADQSLLHDQWQRVSAWITYTDADGNAAVKYQFWDGGTASTSAYFWTSDNSHWAANTTIEVAAANVSDVWVRAGSSGGSETLWARAYDGTAWSNWDSFTLTTVPNTAPVVAVNDQVLHVDSWAQVSNWISYSDANGDAGTKYQFWDGGTGANSAFFWTPNSSHWAANTTIEVSAADLSSVWVKGGSATGSETLWVRAFDGADWGNWDSFNMNSTNTSPVATIADHSEHIDQWAKVGNWLTATDADNDAITAYQFWDGGTSATSGYFWTPTNPHWSSNTVIDVSASEIDSVWVRGGSAVGSESLWVRAFDGHSWGNWETFHFSTTVNTGPVANIGDQNLHVNQWAKPEGWLSTSDAEGDAITNYQFWDGGTSGASAYFWSPNNSHWAASTAIDVSASELSDFWIRAGASTGTETMYVRAFDGASWSSWDSFTFNSMNAAPVAAINDHNLTANQWAQVVNWTSATDADGDAITRFQFWDGNATANSGYFWTPENPHWAAGTAIDVDAAQISDVWIRAGTTAGSETMYVRAFDGTAWSAWDSFSIIV